MKEATLTSAHVAESFQSVIDWNAVRNNVSIIARKSLTIIRHEATPWVLTAIAALLMWWGWAVDDYALHKWSAAATLPTFSWALFRESQKAYAEESEEGGQDE